MKRYWQHIVKSTEKRVEAFLRLQIKDRDRFDCGRLDSDILEGRPTIYALTDVLCVYFCEESKYYKNTEVLEAAERGVSFVERWQRPDGSLDLPSCNYYTAPDTSFCFRRLYGAWRILKKYGANEREKELADRYLALLLKCVPIILCGGFHTPNHRWAIAAALLCLAKLAEENGELTLSVADFSRWLTKEERPETVSDLAERLRGRAGQYLAEGIDGDADGEFAERSTGIYNTVVDKAMIFLYELTGERHYLDFLKRNLDAMFYYFDGDGRVFTQNSTRQDHGKDIYPDPYFYLYVYMAQKAAFVGYAANVSDVFDAAAHKIIKDNLERGDIAPDCMYIFMLNDELRRYSFRGYGFLSEYRRFFRGSKVLRVRNARYGYSVLGGKASFLFAKFGRITVGMRIGLALCEVRSFIPSDMEITEDGCILKSEAKGWYYQPFGEHQGTSDWWEMDHKKRDMIYIDSVYTTVTLKELENGLEITVKTEGLDRLPLRVELDIPAESVLESDTFRLTAPKGGSMVLRDGDVLLKKESQRLLIGPGYGTHFFQGHYSGEEKNESGYSIFLNDYTPYERTFRIVEIS